VSKHRATPPPRLRPRYGRMAVLGVSVATTAVGLLGGVGVLPSVAGADAEPAAAAPAEVAVDPVVAVQEAPPADVPTEPTTSEEVEAPPVERVLSAPADSGSGRRAVFSQSDQRVWLVEEDGRVRRSYPVSGSVTDNLGPGTYQVYSRSEDATGIDDSGTMQWFVRFTQGPSGAAIGFHSIPVDDGAPVQTKAQLGTPQSHGCIRQKMVDAKAMWDFAPIGTTVVVIA